MAVSRFQECFKANVPIRFLGKSKDFSSETKIWTCPYGEICIRRPPGEGGEVRVILKKRKIKKEGREKDFGVVDCYRVGGDSGK